mgnify:CR=1 FL=1
MTDEARESRLKARRDRKGRVIAFVLAAMFFFIGWYHFEDRIMAPLRLLANPAERFEAVLLRVGDQPDVKGPSSAGGRGSGWVTIAGEHALYFEGFRAVEFPRKISPLMHSLKLNETYSVEARPWGRPFWRMVKGWLPKEIVRVFNVETRKNSDHRMLISLSQNGETIVDAETIAAAQQGILFGIFLTLFYSLIGVLFALHVVLGKTPRR